MDLILFGSLWAGRTAGYYVAVIVLTDCYVEYGGNCTALSCLCDCRHHPVLSALLLILSASRSLTPDFSLLVPVPFPSSTPLNGIRDILIYGLCWNDLPSLSERILCGLLQIQTLNISLLLCFFSATEPPCFPFSRCCFRKYLFVTCFTKLGL